MIKDKLSYIAFLLIYSKLITSESKFIFFTFKYLNTNYFNLNIFSMQIFSYVITHM